MYFFRRNIFRFTQAVPEVSALIGRMTSAVALQPRSKAKWGSFRTNLRRRPRGSIKSGRHLRTCRRLHRSAPATACAHRMRQTNLSRQSVELGIICSGPSASSAAFRPRVVGADKYAVARAVKCGWQNIRNLRTSLPLLVSMNLEEDRLMLPALVRFSESVQPFSWPNSSRVRLDGSEGRRYVKGFKERRRPTDDIPSRPLYGSVTIEEVVDQAERMRATK